jgi:hypothetical protein
MDDAQREVVDKIAEEINESHVKIKEQRREISRLKGELRVANERVRVLQAAAKFDEDEQL